MNGREAGGMRFDLLDLARAKFLESLKAIRRAAFEKRFEPWQFVRRGGHDNFSTGLMGDAVLAAKGEHLLQALDAEARLFGTRFVIKPAVEHAAVMPGLVSSQPPFLLEQQEAGVWPGLQQS